MSNQIGTLNEKPLHAALKEWYAEPGDILEAAMDGYVIDIVRGDLLIEIQTRHFSAIKKKLSRLVEDHRVRLLYPIAKEKWIVKPAEDGTTIRRKSPRRGKYQDVFFELIRIPELFNHPNLSLELLLIQEEEVRRHDSKRAWRRGGWVTEERHLLQVLDRKRYENPLDFLEFLPADLPDRFTTTDIANMSGIPRRMTTRMAYCLRKMGAIEEVGKQGNSFLYRKAK